MSVALVGAGPGDPGLLTLRGAELLAKAEVVVYDRLSVSDLLRLATPTAELINVGKSPGATGTSQDEINALLVERGRRGLRVVRLKGGDPFVFARGGEEAAALEAAGVEYEVVPGISSAIAVPAYAGIPLTLRHSSTSFTVVTGHEDPGKEGEIEWEAVAKLGGTIVILMGIANLPAIVPRLMTGGLDPGTAVASVQWGTRPEQKVVRATLATILDHLDELAPPSVVVIGRVAECDLGWFENRPLLGQRVVVTRTRSQAGELTKLLRAEGAAPIEVPVISVEPPGDGYRALNDAIGRLSVRRDGGLFATYDWVVLTSPNGASRFCESIRDARDLAGARVAAIGPGTAAVLSDHNIECDLVPERYVAESLLEALLASTGADLEPRIEDMDGGLTKWRALIIRAEVARDVLPEGLLANGWDVDVVPAYRTVPLTPAPDEVQIVRGADAITFTSSSTVTAFLDSFGLEGLPPVVACIGPVTAETARGAGVEVDVVAGEHTIAGLVDALVGHMESRRVGRVTDGSTGNR